METGVILKKGREISLLRRHLWIFSGAIESYPENFEEGKIYPVFSSTKEQVASAYFNSKTSIAGRVVSFGSEDPYHAIKKHIENAVSLRKSLFKDPLTNAFRLINAEGDFLSGLIVDQYQEHLVIQIHTLGMEKLRSFLVDVLKEVCLPKGIYEKSLSPSRKEEGLLPFEGQLFGELLEEVEILESGGKFLVSWKRGQKTGFFLDQREMRQLTKNISAGKKVLNCFSYTGGFSVSALLGGAKKVDSVEISKEATGMAQRNLLLNGFSPEDNPCFAEDVFTFLQNSSLDYDVIILDPPAFAKKKADLHGAIKAYLKLHRQVLQKMPKNSYLLTSSCSHFFEEELLKKVLFDAALEVKRDIKILSSHRLAMDHPINLFHPETSYLKSFLVQVE